MGCILGVVFFCFGGRGISGVIATTLLYPVAAPLYVVVVMLFVMAASTATVTAASGLYGFFLLSLMAIRQPYISSSDAHGSDSRYYVVVGQVYGELG